MACYFYNMLKSEYILSIKMISNERYEELISNRQEYIFEDLIINLNNESIARLDTGEYYLVQRNDEDYDGTLSINEYDVKLAILKPEKSKLELIKDNTPLKLLIYNNDNYELRDIYLTYIPIIQISNSEYYEYRDSGKDVYTSILKL